MLVAPMGGVDATIPASDPSQSICGLEQRSVATSGIPRNGFFRQLLCFAWQLASLTAVGAKWIIEGVLGSDYPCFSNKTKTSRH